MPSELEGQMKTYTIRRSQSAQMFCPGGNCVGCVLGAAGILGSGGGTWRRLFNATLLVSGEVSC